MPEPMDKVIDNLWIGGLAAARDADLLQKNGIKSVLSAMRGRIPIQKTFARHQVLLDDTDEADALVHFPACIAWIDSEIKKGRGVLVHCQAGMSRSAAIVAAYLMYTRNLDVEAALDMIRQARPVIHPNEGFVAQLAIFHSAHYKRTRQNKETRSFYVERAVKEVLNGDGSSLEMDMFAKYPRSPSDSTPNTPFPQPRRRLRCKMCRQELATREHMVDHGQVGPATPAAGYSLSPAVSRRPSVGETANTSRRGSSSTAADGVSPSRKYPGPSEASRRSSFGAVVSPMTPITPQQPQPQTVAPRKPSFGSTISAMTPIVLPESQAVIEPSSMQRERRPSTSEQSQVIPPRRKSFGSGAFGDLSMTPMTNSPMSALERRPSAPDRGHPASQSRIRRPLLALGNDVAKDYQGLSASALDSDEDEGEDEGPSARPTPGIACDDTAISKPSGLPSATLASPRDLAAQIHPNLAALRSSPLISALNSTTSSTLTSMKETNVPGRTQKRLSMNSMSPPLLMPNARCSGYFVEPMKWMEPFLGSGSMSGKIICPNKRCAAKLGNYDWAGVCCSCKEWVVPGFCIHKSKVDEVAI